VSRLNNSPSWPRRFPISREPQTLGESLRKRRFELSLHQLQAAQRLTVSARTLSLWETDKVYPAWEHQPRIAEYLGYDPFTNPALGRPLGNETKGVAFLASGEPLSFGQQITKRRLELKKTRKQCAQELGVSVKTLWSLETSRCQPSALVQKRVAEFLQFDPLSQSPKVCPE
jgi:transcriptional regulator with XRE-family HTH domain